MRRLLTISFVLALLVGLSLIVRPAAAGPGDPGAPLIAGTYMLDFQNAGGPPLRALGTVNADGTLSGCDTNDFGFGGAGLNSPLHGVWSRSGPGAVHETFFFFGYDGQGNHIYTAKTSLDAVSTNGYQSGTTTYTVNIYAPQQDPLDPNSNPIQSVSGTGTFRRVNP